MYTIDKAIEEYRQAAFDIQKVNTVRSTELMAIANWLTELKDYEANEVEQLLGLVIPNSNFAYYLDNNYDGGKCKSVEDIKAIKTHLMDNFALRKSDMALVRCNGLTCDQCALEIGKCHHQMAVYLNSERKESDTEKGD